MIETVVESIRVSLVTQQRVVILKEVEGERHLPIWIGSYEAEAIAMELQGVSAARPLPYDLMKTVIGDLGGAVERILVTDLNEEIYYARILVRQGGRTVEIDSRPSDAIALAVRAQVPILVDDAVMERAGVTLDGEGDGDEATTPAAVEADRERSGEKSPVEDEKLSVFRDFINTLDLDDLDRKKGSSRRRGRRPPWTLPRSRSSGSCSTGWSAAPSATAGSSRTTSASSRAAPTCG